MSLARRTFTQLDELGAQDIHPVNSSESQIWSNIERGLTAPLPARSEPERNHCRPQAPGASDKSGQGHNTAAVLGIWTRYFRPSLTAAALPWT